MTALSMHTATVLLALLAPSVQHQPVSMCMRIVSKRHMTISAGIASRVHHCVGPAMLFPCTGCDSFADSLAPMVHCLTS